MSHVGFIGQIRVPIREVLSTRGLTDLQARARLTESSHPEASSMVLLTAADVARLKPMLAVRDAGRYKRRLVFWCVVFLCCFGGVHLFWVLRSTKARNSCCRCPAAYRSRDVSDGDIARPLTDTLLFAKFAEGAAAGCVMLALGGTLDYRRITGKLSYVFLLAGFVLSAALILFGSGPTGSDAKVNLFGFQPAEVIRVLIVFFQRAPRSNASSRFSNLINGYASTDAGDHAPVFRPRGDEQWAALPPNHPSEFTP